MSDDLRTLGAGEGSSSEALKLQSNYLRGTLPAVLEDDTSHLDEDALQLLKFHGSYQQDDRDERRARKAAGLEKAYQFMVRSRIPGGVLTAEQYLAHDDLAQRFGNGTIRLTTRQGIQLHGVLKANLRASIKAINDALLSTLAACGDVNRNVMTCPAPARDTSHAKVAKYAHRLAEHLAPRTRAYHEIWIDGAKLDRASFDSARSASSAQDDSVGGDSVSSDSVSSDSVSSDSVSGGGVGGGVALGDDEPIYGKTYLPRKFKIGIALPGDNCIDVYTQDIGFVAEFDGEALRGFTVLVGGGMGSTHGKAETYPRLATPLCFVEPEHVVEIAETIVTIQRDYGDRKNRKHARMKYVVEERGIAWFRAELERRLGHGVADPHAVAFYDVDDHLGWRRQSDELWTLGVHIAGGRIADRGSSQLRQGLRGAIDAFRLGVRITGQQNLLLTGIRDEARGDVEAILQRHGIETDPRKLGIGRYAMACPALPTCGLAVAEAERVLPHVLAAVERELAALGLDDEPLSIRMTGCPNGCARPRMGDIGIVGRSLDLYEIYVGGDWPNTRFNTLYASGVKGAALAATLRPALELWQARRTGGESFGDFVQRYGIEALRSAVTVLQPA